MLNRLILASRICIEIVCKQNSPETTAQRNPGNTKRAEIRNSDTLPLLSIHVTISFTSSQPLFLPKKYRLCFSLFIYYHWLNDSK